MSIIKLTAAGDDHTMVIATCEEAKGQYGEQVKFSDGSDTLYLPKASADRQLERCGFEIPLDHDYTAVVGHTLRFSRDPNPKKGASPYWGITLLGKTQEKPSKRLTGPSQPEKTASHAPTSQDPSAPLAGEQETGEGEGDPREARRERQKKAYFALVSDCVQFMQERNARVNGYEPVPVSFEAANSIAATIVIGWRNDGLSVN